MLKTLPGILKKKLVEIKKKYSQAENITEIRSADCEDVQQNMKAKQ
jgi:hypothetical protein